MPYLSDVRCPNCGYEGSLEIPEGLAVSEMPCPECKAKTLVRASKPPIRKIREKPSEI